jgi:hypothetical protein
MLPVGFFLVSYRLLVSCGLEEDEAKKSSCSHEWGSGLIGGRSSPQRAGI